jgi:hypothetical protein
MVTAPVQMLLPETFRITPLVETPVPRMEMGSATVIPPDTSIDELFAVLIDVDGHVFVERDKQLFSMPIEREITLLEVRRYAAEILADLQAQAAAEYTVARFEALEMQKKAAAK